MKKTVALLVAAGSGNRAGGALPKQYAHIAGKPLLAHAIDGLCHPRIDGTQIVIAKEHEALYAEAIGKRELPPPVLGGATRRESVLNGLEALATYGGNDGPDRVLIHDAARPFLPPKVVDRLLDALEEAEGVVPVLPVSDSLAIKGASLGDAVDRENIIKIQTPQAFNYHKILNAHRQWNKKIDATDDAQIARAAGLKVATVAGDWRLEKITRTEDFARAESTLVANLISRTAIGFDVHAFGGEAPLMLGGIHIPHSQGLMGHSDADVALHAITDALLGTISAGDIGEHFSPNDPEWLGTASSHFVQHARALIEARRGCIDHIDVTIICEAPKIGPYRLEMREKIAELLGISLHKISVKATTTEGLGYTGRGEGIAAQAAATVRLWEDK